jgi:hypothetical protein
MSQFQPCRCRLNELSASLFGKVLFGCLAHAVILAIGSGGARI